MRVVIQRVKSASVTINKKIKASCGYGLLIFVGIEEKDTFADIEWLCNKIAGLRIFNDKYGKMNLSVCDVNGDILVVSQFTLHASTRKGNRPSFIKAAPKEYAETLYIDFVNSLNNKINTKLQTGEFGAIMDVSLINDGPATITIDTKDKE